VAFANFVGIAMGSQAELETQIELARRLDMGQEEDAVRLLEAAADVGRVLHGLRLALVTRTAPESESRGPKEVS
jgi:four helix bundle protein